MQSVSNSFKALSIMLSVAALSACGVDAKKTNNNDSNKKTTSVVPGSKTGSSNNTVNQPTEVPKIPTTPAQPGVNNPPVVACSNNYQIAGVANPFLAGAAAGTELNYGRPVTDSVPTNAPVAVVPEDKKCFDAGRQLYFQVGGTIAFDNQPELFSDADGQANNTTSHILGSVNGLSDITAPINSLIAVFLDDTAPASRSAVPEALNFSSVESRDFLTLTPKIGQIFFVGDGKTSDGRLQGFVVPAGTTRLFLAIMDQYEWANNQGQLSGTIQWVKP